MVSWRCCFLASGVLALSACSLVVREPIDQKVEKSTVLITYGDKEGNGSGFFIQGPKEICTVLTASHVLASDDLKIRTHDLKSWPAANTQQIPSFDMAVVTFKPEGSECPYKALPFGDSNKVQRLDKILVAGFPAPEGRKDLIFQIIPGQVTATPPPIVDGYAICYTAPTIGGSSGGPVVNEAGQVVAVHGLADVEVRKMANIREGKVSGEEAQASGTQVGNTGLKWGIPIGSFPKDFKPSTQPDVLSQARKWRSFGNNSYERGEYQSSLDAYKEAIQIKRDYPEAWYGKGNAQLKLKKYEDAIQSYKKAIKLKPDCALAYNGMGEALHRLEKNQDAFDSYDSATKLKPDFALAWLNRGYVALNDLNNPEEALKSFEQATQLSPLDSKAWYGKGETMFKLEQYQPALESFGKAVALNSDYKSVLAEKGNELRRMSLYKDALAFYEKATDIEPDNKDAWDYKCAALNGLKRYAEALDACNQSNKVKDSNSYTWNERGVALENLERYEDALTSYEKALEISPNNSFAESGRDRMKSKLESALPEKPPAEGRNTSGYSQKP